MSLDLSQVKKELQTGAAILVDVRESAEFDEKHIEGALHFPLSDIEDKIGLDILPKNKSLYLYCRRGPRAMRAAEILQDDYPQAVGLTYGLEDLIEKGF